MEHYLVTGWRPVGTLSGMVREAMRAAEDTKKPELEALLSALGNIRWKAGDPRPD